MNQLNASSQCYTKCKDSSNLFECMAECQPKMVNLLEKEKAKEKLENTNEVTMRTSNTTIFFGVLFLILLAWVSYVAFTKQTFVPLPVALWASLPKSLPSFGQQSTPYGAYPPMASAPPAPPAPSAPSAPYNG